MANTSMIRNLLQKSPPRSFPRCRWSHTRTLSSIETGVFPSPLPSVPLPWPKSFDSLHIHPIIRDALASNNIMEPTEIQRLATPTLLSRKNVVLAAETGAGKTLAYLAPLMSLLKQSEQQSTQTCLPMRPSILVLVPTRELLAQVLSVSKSLAHVAKIRVRAAVGGPQKPRNRKLLRESPVDLLVGTPGSVANMREQQLLFISRISTIVLDEADELVSPVTGFGDQLAGLMSTLRERKAHFVYAAATVPTEMEMGLRRWHNDNIEVIRSNKLHRATPSSRVKTTFIRVDGAEDAKLRKLVDILSVATSRANSGKVLIFCDSVQRRQSIMQTLRARGTDAVHLSGEGRDRDDRYTDWNTFVDGQVSVAVCSKSFGRGIDDHQIQTVIMFDVPMTGGEYLHRIGRIRGSGRAYVLVNNREQPIAEDLFLAHVKGLPIAGVSPQKAWKGYTQAGRDRIATDKVVKIARSKKYARWVDERASADGTFRGRKRSISVQHPSGGRYGDESNELVARPSRRSRRPVY